jgi:hypothetical protein
MAKAPYYALVVFEQSVQLTTPLNTPISSWSQIFSNTSWKVEAVRQINNSNCPSHNYPSRGVFMNDIKTIANATSVRYRIQAYQGDF